MARPKKNNPNTPPKITGSFKDTVMLALENFADAEWLGRNSILASPIFLGSPAFSNHNTATYLPKEWGNFLRNEIEIAAQEIKPDDRNVKWIYLPFDLLTLLFFKKSHIKADIEYSEKSRRKSEKEDKLIPNGIFFDHRTRAIQDLCTQLLKRRPVTISTVIPNAKTFVNADNGRKQVLVTCLHELAQKQIVAITGMSGIGKTALAIELVRCWQLNHPNQNNIFWFSFQCGLNDQLYSLIVALGYFLLQHQMPALYSLAMTDRPAACNPSHVFPLIRTALEKISKTTSLLFCFDEIDLILTPTQAEQNLSDYADIKKFIEMFAQNERNNSALLFVGQRVVIEADHYIELTGLNLAETIALFNKAGAIELSHNQYKQLHDDTQGNPLLLKLHQAIYSQTQHFSRITQKLSHSDMAEILLMRIREHFLTSEHEIIDLWLRLCVFPQPVPKQWWTSTFSQPLHTLHELGLIEYRANDTLIDMATALRNILYTRLNIESQKVLHNEAALRYMACGQFTDAAYHLVQGQQPEKAITLWLQHETTETNCGQLGRAFTIFQKIASHQIKDPDARKNLLILRAKLFNTHGEPANAQADLMSEQWQRDDPRAWQVKLRLGEAYQMQEKIDAALNEYRNGIDLIEDLPQIQLALLRRKLSWAYFNLHGEFDQAWAEILRARSVIEKFQGFLMSAIGKYQEAETFLIDALNDAQSSKNEVEEARIHDTLGIHHLRRRDFANANHHFETAYQKMDTMGDKLCSMNTRLNQTWLCNLQGQYRQALALAQPALTFFTELGSNYYIGYAEAFLAEAYCGLDDLASADKHANRALAPEEAQSFPHAVYVKGLIAVKREDYQSSTHSFDTALQAAQSINDIDLQGIILRALAKSYRALGNNVQAETYKQKSLAIWRKLDIRIEFDATETI